jgi:ketosteroid isomerase-like protein
VNVLSADARFTKEWIMTGVHTGDMPDLPATGRPFRIVGAGVGRIGDGRIVELTEYWNLADFLGQVGALPRPSSRESAPIER